MKTLRTKPFLLATAGATVDGRTIEESWLKDIAETYDPKTYGARLNIEHIRGISGAAPFRSYGDVVEVSTAEVEVQIAGKTEKRLGLFGSFDVLEDAKQLNDAGQKVYSSIEVEPNFAGKGKAYLMGVALTDSPASIATERLKFNFQRPGAQNFSRDEGATLQFADDKGDVTPEGSSFLNALTGVLDKFAGQFGGKPKEESKPDPKPDDAPQGFSVDTFKQVFAEFGKTINDAIVAQGNAFREEVDQIGVKLNKLTEEIETTAAPGQQERPLANGNGKFTKTAF